MEREESDSRKWRRLWGVLTGPLLAMVVQYFSSIKELRDIDDALSVDCGRQSQWQQSVVLASRLPGSGSMFHRVEYESDIDLQWAAQIQVRLLKPIPSR